MLYSIEHFIYMNLIIEENTIIKNGGEKKKDFTLMKFCIAMTLRFTRSVTSLERLAVAFVYARCVCAGYTKSGVSRFHALSRHA